MPKVIKRFLVTGSAGFIGAALVSKLLEDGHEVIGIDDLNNYYDKSFDKYDLLNIPKENPKVETEWGKEKSDILGVRKNYLEKSYYENVETEFDFQSYMRLLKKSLKLKKNH